MRRRRQTRVPAAVFALLGWAALGVVGCSKSKTPGQNPVFILEVEARASGIPDGIRFDPVRSRNYLAGSLADSRSMRHVSDLQPEAFRAELLIALASERESDREGELGVYRAVQVQLRLHRRIGERQERLSARGEAFLVQDPDRFDRAEGFEQVLQSAISRAVGNIDLQFQTHELSPESLAVRLKSKRAEERLYVLRSLRDRRVPELVPEVIEMLSDQDDEVVLEAVGVLVAQRDQRAARPLIRMSQTRDPVFQLQIITAMAELGGAAARGYLFTLAAGHSLTDIRDRAREGLETILRREGRETSEQRNPEVALPRSAEPDVKPNQRGAK